MKLTTKRLQIFFAVGIALVLIPIILVTLFSLFILIFPKRIKFDELTLRDDYTLKFDMYLRADGQNGDEYLKNKWLNFTGNKTIQDNKYLADFKYDSDDWETNADVYSEQEAGDGRYIFSKITAENSYYSDWGVTSPLASIVNAQINQQEIQELGTDAPDTYDYYKYYYDYVNSAEYTKNELKYLDFYSDAENILDLIKDASKNTLTEEGYKKNIFKVTFDKKDKMDAITNFLIDYNFEGDLNSMDLNTVKKIWANISVKDKQITQIKFYFSGAEFGDEKDPVISEGGIALDFKKAKKIDITDDYTLSSLVQRVKSTMDSIGK